MKVNLRDKTTVRGKIRITLEDIYTGEKEITEYKNLVPTVGREAIGRRIILEGLRQDEGAITYGAVGTGTTAPVNSDTQLETELTRKQIASATYSANIIRIRTFFTAAEAVGTLREYGLFGEEATAAADSGTLFQRVSINKVKTNTKTLTIESEITIS